MDVIICAAIVETRPEWAPSNAIHVAANTSAAINKTLIETSVSKA